MRHIVGRLRFLGSAFVGGIENVGAVMNQHRIVGFLFLLTLFGISIPSLTIYVGWKIATAFGALVIVLVTLEGAYAKAKTKTTPILNVRATRLLVKTLLGKRRTVLYDLSEGKDDEIQRELQATLDLVEAAFGQGEGARFSQGSKSPMFRVRGTPDWQFRLKGALMDIDDLIARADTVTLEDSFMPEKWEPESMPVPTPDTGGSPPK